MTQQMAILIVETLIKYGPTLALEVAKIFEKKEHGLADWNAVFAQAKTYEQIMAPSVLNVT